MVLLYKSALDLFSKFSKKSEVNTDFTYFKVLYLLFSKYILEIISSNLIWKKIDEFVKIIASCSLKFLRYFLKNLILKYIESCCCFLRRWLWRCFGRTINFWWDCRCCHLRLTQEHTRGGGTFSSRRVLKNFLKIYSI